MSNIGGHISAGVTVTLGIFNLNNNQFEPTTLFFYLIGIVVVAFVVSFAGEWVQDKVYEWMHHRKTKGKKEWHGIGR